MPRESIGEAYVRIISDGSDLGHSIRRDLEGVDFEEEGRQHGKNFYSGFEDSGEEKKFGEKLKHSVGDPLARGHWLRDEFFKGENWQSWRKEMETRFGASGRLVANRFEHDLLNGLSMDGLTKRLEDLTPHLTKARRDIANGFDDRPVTKFRRRVQEADGVISKFADRTGRSFGKGSRNDALNFFGSIIGGGVSLLNIFPKLTEGVLKIKDGFSSLAATWTEADTTGGKLAAVSVQLGGAMASTIAGAAVLAAALTLVSVIVGPLVALISGLVAAVVALASTLAFAAVAGVAVLAGALLPLVAGLGVLMLAFHGITGQSKKAKAEMENLKKSFGPLRTEFGKLATSAREAIEKHIGQAARIAAPGLHAMIPLVHGISDAMGQVMVGWAKQLNTPAFHMFLDAMRIWLPHAIIQLGSIMMNTFGGMLGMFRAILPITSQFLNWLQRITGEFARWSNSPAGQKSLKKFFDDAAASGRSVWNLIVAISHVIGSLFSQGRGTGNSIFDDLTKKANEFSRWLDSHRGAVKAWFANGLQTARDVGHAIESIIGFFRKLDTPENRQAAHNIFGALMVAIRVTGSVLGTLSGIVGGFIQQMKDAKTEVTAVWHAIASAAGQMAGGVVNAFAHILRGIANVLGAAAHIPGPMGHAFGVAARSVGAAATATQDLANKLRGLPTSKSPKVSLPGIDSALSKAARLATALDRLHDRTVRVNYILAHHPGSGNGPVKLPDGGGGGSAGATGFMANWAQQRLIGEAGREAVVPLDRPLSQIDPAVRDIAAFAQGRFGSMGAGGIVGNSGRSLTISEGAITVIDNTGDSRATAAEVFNRALAAAY